MGRQAKLKKARQQEAQQPSSFAPSQLKTTDFVKQLKKEGYQLQQIQHSPELPSNKPEPII